MSADIVSQLRGEVFVPVVQTADFSHSDNLAGGGRRRRPMLRRILVEAEVGALPMVQVDNTTPIVSSREASSIPGIHGAGALSRCTRY